MKINTGIPATKKRLEIIGSVIGQMSDGIWENTRSMEKYWKSLDYEKGTDGNIWLEDRGYVCANVKDFFANKIKQIIKIEAEDHPSDGIEWSRSCTALTCYLNYYEAITVGDCYELYELLKGRKTDTKSYSTYSDYAVTLTFDTLNHTMVVNALSEEEAKKKAIEKLTKQLEVKVIKA